MKSLKPKISIIQKSYVQKDGTREVRIRVRYAGGRADDSYETGVYLTAKEFKSIIKDKNTRSTAARESYVRVMAEYTRAEKLASDTKGNANTFEVMFTGTSGDLSSVQDSLRVVIEQRKLKSNKEGKTYSFKQHVVLLNFLNDTYGRDVLFTEIDTAWLKDMETRLYAAGSAVNNVRSYHVVLRAMFNIAIHEWKTLSEKVYPYGKGGFKVRKSKKANNNLLRGPQRATWLTYQPANESEREALDYWRLSYYLVGVNFKDILTWRVSQLAPDFSTIRYVRSKSADSKDDVVEAIKSLHPVVIDIIKRRMVKSLNPNAFIFPVVNDSMTYLQQVTKIKNFIGKVNAQTKEISKNLGLSIPVRTYTARHTAAQTLKESGASILQIGELLDHSDTRTTESYMHSMDIEYQQKLIMGL